MTLHCTENLHSCMARTGAVNTALCPANHLAITAGMVCLFCETYNYKRHTQKINDFSAIHVIKRSIDLQLWILAHEINKACLFQHLILYFTKLMVHGASLTPSVMIENWFLWQKTRVETCDRNSEPLDRRPVSLPRVRCYWTIWQLCTGDFDHCFLEELEKLTTFFEGKGPTLLELGKRLFYACNILERL